MRDQMSVLEPGESIANGSSAVTIGKFDGVHLGHRALLAKTRSLADEIGGVAGIITFDRHPLEVLRPGSEPLCLSPLSERLDRLAASGMDFCILLPLGDGVLDWPAERFVADILVHSAKARHVVTGEDFRYGRGRVGDIHSLRSSGAAVGFDVHIVQPVQIGGQRVSSYAVRRAIVEGNLELASSMLGRAYSIDGTVIRGRQLGRTLGFPTANIGFHPSIVLPANGVYAVRADWGEGDHRAVANLGVRPTVDNTSAVVLEVHLLDWSGEIYGERMRVSFDRRIRAEKRFESLDDLKAQIESDVIAARAL